MSHLAIENEYGNVDLTCTKISQRYRHVRGKRLQPLCRKLGIKYADAVVGFKGSRKYGYRPVKDGVIVSVRAEKKLLAEIEAREKRNSPEKREAERQRRAERKSKRLHEAGIIDSTSRTAKWFLRGEIDAYEARLIQFKTSYRHEHTDYDARLDQLKSEAKGRRGEDRRFLAQEASATARDTVYEQPIPAEWKAYLLSYDFPFPEVAKAIAAALQSPKKAHPIWFCEAVLAVKRADIDLDSLSYETIRDAISSWRSDRYES